MSSGRLLRRSSSMARDRIFDELRLENVDLFLDGVADDVVKKLVGDVILALGDVPRPPTVLLCHRLRGSVHEDLTLVHPHRASAQLLDHLRRMVDEQNGAGLGKGSEERR